MSKDFAYRLQNYAYTMIMDDFGLEFDEYLNDWQVRCNDLVNYTSKALNSFQGQLEYLKEELKAEKARNNQLAMFVLSLLGGAALSFVAGALQYRLGPSLFGTKSSEKRNTPDKAWSDEWVQSGKDNVYKVANNFIKREVFDPDLAKTKGKVIGDLGSRLANDFMVSPAIRAAAPDLSNLSNALNRVPDSADLENLRTNLNNTWLQAQIAGKQAIKGLANTIRDDSKWGDRLWDWLEKLNPRTSDYSRFEFGKVRIQWMVNAQRQKWSTQPGWFYYGNTPAPLSEVQVVNAIEVELWALWIAQEHYEATYWHHDGNRLSDEWDGTKSRSGIEINKVMPRLRELGVVAVASQIEKMRRLNPSSKSGVQPAEVKNIDGDVDNGLELRAINDWAKNRKPQIFGGRIGSVPRALGPMKIRTITI